MLSYVSLCVLPAHGSSFASQLTLRFPPPPPLSYLWTFHQCSKAALLLPGSWSTVCNIESHWPPSTVATVSAMKHPIYLGPSPQLGTMTPEFIGTLQKDVHQNGPTKFLNYLALAPRSKEQCAAHGFLWSVPTGRDWMDPLVTVSIARNSQQSMDAPKGCFLAAPKWTHPKSSWWRSLISLKLSCNWSW